MSSMGYADYSSYSDPTMLGTSAVIGSIVGTYSIIILALYVLQIIAQWKIFAKAGQAGWKSLIPIYNMVVFYKIVGLSPWLLLLYLTAVIPIVGYIAILVLTIVSKVKLGKAFGQETGFIIGLILLPSIFDLILAFGKSTYVREEATE